MLNFIPNKRWDQRISLLLTSLWTVVTGECGGDVREPRGKRRTHIPVINRKKRQVIDAFPQGG
jgi:hypothetical protein